MKDEMINKEKGFTLIELLVVIFIIGILAGFLFPNFVSSRQRARDAVRKHDLAQIKNALRIYYNDYQTYPAASSNRIVACGEPPAACAWNSFWQRSGVTYMQRLPFDPMPAQSYGYCVSADGNGFLVWAALENEGDTDADTSSDRCGVSDGTRPCAPSCPIGRICYYLCGN